MRQRAASDCIWGLESSENGSVLAMMVNTGSVLSMAGGFLAGLFLPDCEADHSQGLRIGARLA